MSESLVVAVQSFLVVESISELTASVVVVVVVLSVSDSSFSMIGGVPSPSAHLLSTAMSKASSSNGAPQRVSAISSHVAQASIHK